MTPHAAFVEMLERACVDYDGSNIGPIGKTTTEPARPSCSIVKVGFTEFHFDEEGELRFVWDDETKVALSAAMAIDPCDVDAFRDDVDV